MSLQIKIDGQCEAMVRSQLAEGHARSPEELVERALAAYSANTSRQFSLGRSRKTAAEAVADIRELRKTVDLAGLKIEDLIHEGHKY
jgi:hypothetical protein